MLCAVAGASLVALRPPMPWKGEIGFWYDAEHVPDVSRDDVDVYGERVGAKNRGWPAWLLIASILAGLFVASAPGAAGRQSGGRTPRVGRPRAADAVRALRVWRRGVRRVPRDGIFPGRGRDARRVSHRGVRVVRGRVGVHVRAVRVVADVRAVDLRRRGRVSLRRARVAVGGGARAGDDWARREDARAGVLGASAGVSLQVAFAVKIKADGVRGDRGDGGGRGVRRGVGGGASSLRRLRRSRRFRGVVPRTSSVRRANWRDARW